jgi:kynurenine formamidase
MAERAIHLSFPLRSDAPSPPAIPAIELSPLLTLAADGANVTKMTLTSHTGTHLDVPRHVIRDGLTLTDLEPADFIFDRPVVVDLRLGDGEIVQPKDLEAFVGTSREVDLLLFRFGYADVRRKDKTRFSVKAPGFGVESARFLRKEFPALRGVGMDVPSLSCIEHLDDTMAAHHELLSGEGRRFIVVEDMDLEHDLKGLRRVIVAPLRVDQGDGGPVTAYGMIEA